MSVFLCGWVSGCMRGAGASLYCALRADGLVAQPLRCAAAVASDLIFLGGEWIALCDLGRPTVDAASGILCMRPVGLCPQAQALRKAVLRGLSFSAGIAFLASPAFGGGAAGIICDCLPQQQSMRVDLQRGRYIGALGRLFDEHAISPRVDPSHNLRAPHLLLAALGRCGHHAGAAAMLGSSRSLSGVPLQSRGTLSFWAESGSRSAASGGRP
ncbi:hypothetical protein B0H15DRAFT_841096 [Mycena belliarum]|uniref:Uncharacterized protein n=1 Tax=Mycena belliarum TaxID=1033014 RepID=A0AAD6XR47_9AGAR|nr:hypothetical protein B0H15DRAFT_841096 [Mycena belliae]